MLQRELLSKETAFEADCDRAVAVLKRSHSELMQELQGTLAKRRELKMVEFRKRLHFKKHYGENQPIEP